MQKHKWHGEIMAWAVGAEIELRYKGTGAWCKDSAPPWHAPDFEFRIYNKHREVKEAMLRGEACQYKGEVDPYQHLRDAMRAGETVEFICYPCGEPYWMRANSGPIENYKFSYPPHYYRVVTEKQYSQHGAVVVGRLYFEKTPGELASTSIVNCLVCLDSETKMPVFVELEK